MEDRDLDDLFALLQPLLQALDALGFVARHLNPLLFEAVMDHVGAADEPLRSVRPDVAGWSDGLAHMRPWLETASDAVLEAFNALRAASDEPDVVSAMFRAMRKLPRAEEALYPLAAVVPMVSLFFLDAAGREDADLQARLMSAQPRDDVGVMHFGNDLQSRGGYSVYVPEYYDPGVSWPLVTALHGGGGHGRSFLWSWLREARSRGAILIAPTSVGRTWELMAPDPDIDNIERMVEAAQRHWNIDPTRRLLAGMSDGGTFAYIAGLTGGSPFTHLAPISAAFHPMLVETADRAGLRGRPIHIVHGALDWMFPIDSARQARQVLSSAEARVSYLEIADLSHCFPREVVRAILDWSSSA